MNAFKPFIMMTVTGLLTAASCSTGGAGEAAAPKADASAVVDGKFTPEVLNSFGRVSDPQLSPDGKKVLFGVSFVNLKENKLNRDLWVIDIDGSNPMRLTSTPNSESNAVWIDGGKRIAFAYRDDTDDNATTQMWVMNADGSGRQQVSRLDNGIEGFTLSPDEKKVMIVTTVQYGQRVTDVHPDMPKSDARIIDDMMYRHWNEWTQEVPHPLVGDFTGSDVKGLKDVLEGTEFESPMRPWGGVEQLAFTPDSKSLIYTCRKKTGVDYAISTNSDLYQFDLASGATTADLTQGMMGYDQNPVISKSGKIAWLSMEHDGYEADKNRIFVLDGGVKKDLTANWDFSVDEIAWSPDEKYIYFIAPFHGRLPIFRMDVATQQVDTVAMSQHDYHGLTVLDDGTVLTTRQSFLEPSEIFTVKMGQEPKQLTSVNQPILDKIEKVDCHEEWVTTTDGKQMLVWVLTPPNFDPAKQYPAIFFCEGGPQSPVSQFWSYRWNLRIMANHGYVVIAPNRRGLPGFGTEWNAQISGDYAGQNMKDYLSAVDHMRAKPYVDAAHIGCVGASYGGFSTYWLAGNHNGRFAAFLSHAGIFDLRAQYCETEELWFVNWDLGGAPWDKANAVAQRSYTLADPKNYVQNWDKPIMVTTGENDFRISYTQTMQAFNAAKLRGLPARMVLYPSEDHWVQRPQNSVVWQREFFGWLDQWLMPGTEAAKSRPLQAKPQQAGKQQQ